MAYSASCPLDNFLCKMYITLPSSPPPLYNLDATAMCCNERQNYQECNLNGRLPTKMSCINYTTSCIQNIIENINVFSLNFSVINVFVFRYLVIPKDYRVLIIFPVYYSESEWMKRNDIKTRFLYGLTVIFHFFFFYMSGLLLLKEKS